MEMNLCCGKIRDAKSGTPDKVIYSDDAEIKCCWMVANAKSRIIHPVGCFGTSYIDIVSLPTTHPLFLGEQGYCIFNNIDINWP